MIECCPYCGCDPLLAYTEDGALYGMVCPNDCIGTWMYFSEIEAICAWNDRCRRILDEC